MKPYYERDGIEIYHGNCCEVLPTLNRTKKFDMVLTDPPFESEAHTLQRRLLGGTMGVGKRELVTGMSISFDAITEETRIFVSDYFSKNCNGWSLVFCQAEAISKWKECLELSGAKFKRAMIWVKPDGTPQYNGQGPAQGYESIATAWCGEGRSKWNGGGRHGVFIVNKNEGNGPHLHQTQKPLKLMTLLLSLFSNEGDTILDAFMGSGQTLRACKDLKRKSVGIDIDEKNCEISALRLAQEVLAL